MRPFVTTVNASADGTSYSKVFVVDHYANPINIGVGVVGTNSAIYTVQHTFSDPFALNLNTASNGVWLNNSYIVNSSANTDTNYAFAPTAIRLALSSAASAQAIFTVIQAGI